MRTRNASQTVTGLSFDLDGTLLDGSRVQDAILETCETIAAALPGLEAARLIEANAGVWESYWPEVEDKWVLGGLDGASLSLEAWRRTLQSCGVDDESVARLAWQTFGELEREAVRLFDDAQAVLTTIRRAGIPLALVSNGPSDTQRGKLQALGIEDWFDAVVISGEIGVAKPDPVIFEVALGRLAVSREGLWHVGDWPPTDVAGANAAGVTSIWLNRHERPRTEGEPVPDIEIRSLSDLVPLLII